ncbi:hypothetical protein NDU88_005332 [Pleurodeles waltl]|uniref:Uncharacterized protein n=1 Tax=Pleurodeles waltl TaxID=8319 RepID=A0AAV7M908_PLEWA|nr:hypothetical protein NDU88_005332 [Pleurodeles waltl]
MEDPYGGVAKPPSMADASSEEDPRDKSEWRRTGGGETLGRSTRVPGRARTVLKPTEPAKGEKRGDRCVEGNAWCDPLLDRLQEEIHSVKLKTTAGTVAWLQTARPWQWVARMSPSLQRILN